MTLQFKPTHAGHIRIDDQARGVAYALRSEKFLRRAKTSTAKPDDSINFATVKPIGSSASIIARMGTLDTAQQRRILLSKVHDGC